MPRRPIRSISYALAIGGASLVAPGVAHADPAQYLPSIAVARGAPSSGAASPLGATDTIELDDGTVLRGQVAEMHPGREATFVLVTGETRTIPFARMASAAGPGFSTLDPDYFSHRAAELARRPASGRSPLRVESTGRPQTIALTAAIAPGVLAPAVCTTPCTLYLRPGVTEFFARDRDGRGAWPVGSFMLPASGLSLRVRPAAQPGLGLGVAGVVIGLIGTSTSWTFFVIGAGHDGAMFDAGLVGVITSGALLTGGIIAALYSDARITSSRPLPVAPSVGVAPVAGGAVAALTTRF